MLLPILKYGDPILQKLSDPVTVFDKELEKLAKDMSETMYAAPGVGLAAPQVGVLKRLIVSRQGDQYEDEGCLSIPDFTGKVHRPYSVVVSGKDLQGREKIMEGEGLLSRVFCHEIDHLNGVLFIDHLGAIKRDIIKRKIRKKVRAGEW
jgi:peptide deformylase